LNIKDDQKTNYVFISYNRADKDFAGLLMLQLEKAGIDTWMDNVGLRGGQDWSAEIDLAIKEASALIVIMSPDAKSSEYVTYEWAFAIGAGVPVIPIFYKPTELHPRLSRLQYRDFTQSVYPWDDLVSDLRVITEKKTYIGIKVPKDAPRYIKEAIEALDSVNPETRRQAVEVLSSSNYEQSHEILASALNHPIPRVSIDCALVIGEKGDRRAVPVLEDAILNNNSLYNAHDWARVINCLHNLSAIVELLGLIKDKEITTQCRVNLLLGCYEIEEALPYLIHNLTSEEPMITCSILFGLSAKTHIPEILQAFITELDDIREIDKEDFQKTFLRKSFDHFIIYSITRDKFTYIYQLAAFILSKKEVSEISAALDRFYLTPRGRHFYESYISPI
jgi:hypothetical protein